MLDPGKDMLGIALLGVDETLLGCLVYLQVEDVPPLLVCDLEGILDDIVGVLIVKHLD